MEGMGLIKSIQETDGRAINSVLFIEYDWIRINTTEYIWKLYLGLESKGIIITPKFTIISI